MTGLKVFLVIVLVGGIVYGLLLLAMPTQMAEAGMGPQDIPSARYMAAILLGLSVAVWYAFRNPRKNVAVVRALITIMTLNALVGLFNGVTGAEEWNAALPAVIFGFILAIGMAYFHPWGEKAT